MVERVRARLRRPAIAWGDTISVRALRIDLAAHRVEVGDAPVELTRVEFELLAAVARKPGEVRTRSWLTDSTAPLSPGTAALTGTNRHGVTYPQRSEAGAPSGAPRHKRPRPST